MEKRPTWLQSVVQLLNHTPSPNTHIHKQRVPDLGMAPRALSDAFEPLRADEVRGPGKQAKNKTKLQQSTKLLVI